MDWSNANEKNGLYEIPDRWISINHYAALNIMFRVENALRIFVYCVLKNTYGSKWRGLEISTAETPKIPISNLVSQRLKQHEDFKYLGASVACPMMFLNSGELIHLLFSETHWPRFAKHLKGKKEVLRIKLDEIATIRNALAHFRPITKDYVDVLKQNAKHVFGGIEEFLREISSCHRAVPTNTDAAWYRALSVLGNDFCKVSLHESPNQEWIRVELNVQLPVTESRKYNTLVRAEVLNFVTPAILYLYQKISENVINLSEWMPRPAVQDGLPQYHKQVSLLFGAKKLIDSYEDIRQDVEALLGSLAEEKELLVNDHLARGKLLSVQSLYASLQGEGDKAHWNWNEDGLLCPSPADDPPEYWRSLGRWDAGFLDLAHQYPWMPVEISKEEIPF